MTERKDQRFTAARKQLALAYVQLDEAATASWPPPDEADCVSMCFYSFENAVVAAAIALQIQWKKRHPDKAKIAARLAKEGHVSRDVSALLGSLNNLRKDVSYGHSGPELKTTNLEGLVADLEQYLVEIEQVISNAEGN